MPTPEEVTQFQQLVMEAASVDEILAIVSGAYFDPAEAFQYAAAVAPVVDAGFVLACLRHSDTGWMPAAWLENPQISPGFDAQCASYWARTLTSGVGAARTCEAAHNGLIWLLEHNRMAAVTPQLEALQGYVIRGRSPEPSAPRYQAYRVLVEAVRHQIWSSEVIVQWRRTLPGGFVLGAEEAEILLFDPSLPAQVFEHVLRELPPTSILHRVLALRSDIRRNPKFRASLWRGIRPWPGRPRPESGAWRFGADAMDDFEQCIEPFLSPGEDLEVGHSGVAMMLHENPGPVAARLGSQRLRALTTSPVADLRTQALLALAQSGLSQSEQSEWPLALALYAALGGEAPGPGASVRKA